VISGRKYVLKIIIITTIIRNMENINKTSQELHRRQENREFLKHLAVPNQKCLKLKFTETAIADSSIIYYFYYHHPIY